MFIVPNPPKSKSKAKAKKSAAKVAPWTKTLRKKAAAEAKKRNISKADAMKLLGAERKALRGKWLTKKQAAKMRGMEMRSTVCHPKSLASAMQRYCSIHPKRRRHGVRASAVAAKTAPKAASGKKPVGPIRVPKSLPKSQKALEKLLKREIKKHDKVIAASKKAESEVRAAKKYQKGIAARSEELGSAYEDAMASRRESMGEEFNPLRRRSMRKAKYAYKPKRRNIGEFLTMNPAVAPYELRDIVSPGRTAESLLGVAPFAAGAGVSYLATKLLASQNWVPNFFKGGLGNYILSGGVGLALGTVAGRMVDRDIGKQVMYGAAAGVAASMLGDALGGGLKALAPRGFAGIDEYLGCQGMGCANMGSDPFDPMLQGNGTLDGLDDFVMPSQIQSAIPTANTASQYPVPQNAQAQQEAAVLSEVMSDTL